MAASAKRHLTVATGTSIAESDAMTLNENIGHLVRVLSQFRTEFFIREKSNLEWEAGFGRAAGEDSERAYSPLEAMQALAKRHNLV